MYLNIKSLNFEPDSSINVSDNVFCKKYNEGLVHQLLESYISYSHSGTRAQKNRSEVSGGGAKPWKQKGTGRARAGSIRSPIFRKGGVTFAARSYENRKKKINKKMYKIGLCSIFSKLLKENRLSIIKGIDINLPKTNIFVDMMKKNNIFNAIFIVSVLEFTSNLVLSSRNVKNINIFKSNNINLISLINSNKILITKDAVKSLEGSLL